MRTVKSLEMDDRFSCPSGDPRLVRRKLEPITALRCDSTAISCTLSTFHRHEALEIHLVDAKANERIAITRQARYSKGVPKDKGRRILRIRRDLPCPLTRTHRLALKVDGQVASRRRKSEKKRANPRPTFARSTKTKTSVSSLRFSGAPEGEDHPF